MLLPVPFFRSRLNFFLDLFTIDACLATRISIEVSRKGEPPEWTKLPHHE